MANYLNDPFATADNSSDTTPFASLMKQQRSPTSPSVSPAAAPAAQYKGVPAGTTFSNLDPGLAGELSSLYANPSNYSVGAISGGLNPRLGILDASGKNLDSGMRIHKYEDGSYVMDYSLPGYEYLGAQLQVDPTTGKLISASAPQEYSTSSGGPLSGVLPDLAGLAEYAAPFLLAATGAGALGDLLGAGGMDAAISAGDLVGSTGPGFGTAAAGAAGAGGSSALGDSLAFASDVAAPAGGAESAVGDALAFASPEAGAAAAPTFDPNMLLSDPYNPSLLNTTAMDAPATPWTPPVTSAETAGIGVPETPGMTTAASPMPWDTPAATPAPASMPTVLPTGTAAPADITAPAATPAATPTSAPTAVAPTGTTSATTPIQSATSTATPAPGAISPISAAGTAASAAGAADATGAGASAALPNTVNSSLIGGAGAAAGTAGNTSTIQSALQALGLESASGGLGPNVLPAVGLAASTYLQSQTSKNVQNELAAIGGSAKAVGDSLLNKFSSGQLTPADAFAIQQWEQQAEAQAKQYYAKAGMADSTMLNQTLMDIRTQAEALRSQAMNNMLQEGLSAIQTASGPLGNAVNYQIQSDTNLQNSMQNFLKMLSASQNPTQTTAGK